MSREPRQRGHEPRHEAGAPALEVGEFVSTGATACEADSHRHDDAST